MLLKCPDGHEFEVLRAAERRELYPQIDQRWELNAKNAGELVPWLSLGNSDLYLRRDYDAWVAARNEERFTKILSQAVIQMSKDERIKALKVMLELEENDVQAPGAHGRRATRARRSQQ